ncbi:MAG: hypothetical protein AAF391_13655 [Bacteroidota bacterium]
MIEAMNTNKKQNNLSVPKKLSSSNLKEVIGGKKWPFSTIRF